MQRIIAYTVSNNTQGEDATIYGKRSQGYFLLQRNREVPHSLNKGSMSQSFNECTRLLMSADECRRIT